MLVNKQELAEIVGKSERTLTTWQKNGMPICLDGGRGAANQYEPSEVIAWMIEREITARLKDHGGDVEQFYDYELERGRLTHHQANKTALEEQKLSGELIPADIVRGVWSDYIARYRARSLAIPSKGAHLFLNLSELEEIQNKLKGLVYECLAELAEYEPSDYGIRANSDSLDDCSAAADPDG